MLPLGIIRYLLVWAMIAVGIPGALLYLALVKRLNDQSSVIIAWSAFAFVEIDLHVVLIRALMRGWNI